VKILALSTSTPRGSAALWDGGEVVGEVAYIDLVAHAERLFGAFDELLARAGLARNAIDAIACDIGPGSFTGVRVGVASAKGIALALGVPILGVVSLRAMAAAAFALGAAGPDAAVLASIDAKKGELFVGAYGADGHVLAPESVVQRSLEGLAPCLAALAPRTSVLVGDVPEGACPVARGEAIDLPSAAWVARLAALRMKEGRGDPAESELEPFYVRPPDAKPSHLGYTPPQ
jgi:tRNA threonylcarbamoyladenosine biosynthesis protein TsaB